MYLVKMPAVRSASAGIAFLVTQLLPFLRVGYFKLNGAHFLAISPPYDMIKEKAVSIVKLNDVKKLLDENGYPYTQSVIPSRAEFYRLKGFCPSTNTGAFLLLVIPNPHHQTNIEIIFDDATEDPNLYDLEFGGYWYELFDCEEEHLQQELLTEIQRIINGEAYFIFAQVIRKGVHWAWDAIYYNLPDDQMNDMAAFHKAVTKIKTPKSWWKKRTGRQDIYEIYNWSSYEKIVK